MSSPRIAYLTGEYPKVSHTFIQREIAALRRQGCEVLACTVRRAPAKDVVGEEQLAEQRETWCVLENAKNPLRLLTAHARVFARSPRGWLSALALAWRTRPPGVKAMLWQMFYFLEAGVLAEVTGILAKAGVSIDAVLQREADEVSGDAAQTDLIILTHDVKEGVMNTALATIEALPTVLQPVVRIRKEELA